MLKGNLLHKFSGGPSGRQQTYARRIAPEELIGKNIDLIVGYLHGLKSKHIWVLMSMEGFGDRDEILSLKGSLDCLETKYLRA
jgi:hypothetical protein